MNKLNRILFSLCLFTCSLSIFAQNEEEQKKFNFGLKMGMGTSGWIQQYTTRFPRTAEKVGQQPSGSYVFGAFIQNKIKGNCIFQLEANYQNIGNTFYHYIPTIRYKIVEYRFTYLQVPISIYMPLNKKGNNTYFRVGLALNFLNRADKELSDYHKSPTHSKVRMLKENLDQHNVFISQTVLGFGSKIGSKLSIELTLHSGLNYEIDDDDFCFGCIVNEDLNDDPFIITNRNLQLVCYYSFRN